MSGREQMVGTAGRSVPTKRNDRRGDPKTAAAMRVAPSQIAEVNALGYPRSKITRSMCE
jgi:hypothetical protein